MPEPKLNREDHLKAREQGSFWGDLGSHLEELRSAIIISTLFLTAAIATCFYYSENLISLMQNLAPVNSSFFQLKPGELFSVSLKVSLYTGFYLTLPIIISQIYFFVKPALTKDENKICLLVAFLAPVLFWLGLFFAYVFLLPSLLDFLLNFKEGLVEKSYGLESFVSLVLSIETITALAFQLPVMIFILGILNLVKVKQLLDIWRYVILLAFVFAAFLTPTPDPLTMSVLACALLVLYFSTIIFLKLFRK
jgi:sec-independent protein translocase protein TatC